MRHMRRRATACTVLLCGTAVACVPLGALAASKVKTVAVRDATDMRLSGALDITRVQLGIASDGRLRAAITLAKGFSAKSLLAKAGPPGSICLRVWTLTKPVGIPPDFLVCVTATASGKAYRGTVSAEQVNAQPKYIGAAKVTKASSRTVVVKFSRSSVARPKTTVRFAAEATKPGCTRTSCVDTAPDAPSTATLKLRS